MANFVVNPKDKKYYTNWEGEPTGYVIQPYPNTGGYYYLDSFVVYCTNDNLEEALEKLVAYLSKDSDLKEAYLKTQQELVDEGIDLENDEYYQYVDATMEGADQPYYINIVDLYASELDSGWRASKMLKDTKLKESRNRRRLNSVSKIRKLNEFYGDGWNNEIDEETLADWVATGEVEDDWNGGYSVELFNKNDGNTYWLDCQKDSYGDWEVDWNQYIFRNNSGDRWVERVQKNVANFDSAMSIALYQLELYLKQQSKDGLEERYKNRIRRKKMYESKKKTNW